MIEGLYMTYQRPPGSVDLKIEEIPLGKYRVRIIGKVVDKSMSSITINDGTGSILLDIVGIEREGLDIATLGRFICEVNKSNELLSGKLVAWTPISRERLEKYWKLVAYERRIPKNKTDQSPK